MFTTVKMIRNLSYQTRTSCKFLKNTILTQKLNRNIHCNTKLCKKMYLEHENSFAYDIMKTKGYVSDLRGVEINNMAVSKEMFEKALKEDWSKKSPTQIYEAFSALGSYSSENGLCISNKIFDSFIDALTDNISKASDQELRLLFYYLLKWPETESLRTRNYIEVWAALDDECMNRIRIWSFDEMLSFMALFYTINVCKASDFCLKCLNKLATRAKQLTPNQLVQTMFFVGLKRKSPFDMHNLEIQLNQLFTEFTVDELAIISMGFFKSKTPVRNMELISKIIDEIITHSKEIHEVSLAALLKIIRYSVKVSIDSKIYNLLDVLQHEVPRMSIMCNIHLALLGTATLTLHEKCLTDIASSAIENINKARLKDLERLVFTYGTFNLINQVTEQFFQNVLDELRKPDRLLEIEKHGRSFACCISYLGHLGIYPTDLMNKVLSSEFLQKTYGKHVMTYGREVLMIHNLVKIFCDEDNMSCLSDKHAIMLGKKYTDFVPCETFVKQYNMSEKMVLDIIKNVKEFRGGDDYVVGDHIVTHHQKGDIIVCNDRNGTPVKVAEHFHTSTFGLIRRPPTDDVWIALVIAGRNVLIQNTEIATGPFQAKMRELEALGFHTALVPWSKYSTLESKKAKIDYLRGLIEEAAHNKSKCKIRTCSIK